MILNTESIITTEPCKLLPSRPYFTKSYRSVSLIFLYAVFEEGLTLWFLRHYPLVCDEFLSIILHV